MNRAFGVIGGGFGAGEFDGVDAAEVLDLVAFGFKPDILDAGNFSSHVLDAVDGFFPVVIRNIIPEFVHDHVQHCFRLAETVLYGSTACMQRTSGDSRNEYGSAQGKL